MPLLRLSHRRIPLAIAVIFAVVGSAWILLSDTLQLPLSGSTAEQLSLYQTDNGLVFGLASAVLIWWLTRRSLPLMAEAGTARHERESRYRRNVEKTTSIGLRINVEALRGYSLLAREDQPRAESTPAPGGLRGGQERILLVEDEEAIRGVAQRALEKAGYRVLTAQDGLEALEIYHRQPSDIDLIITDVMMPRLGGIELYRALRQEGHAVWFLFTSGHAPEEIMQGNLSEAGLTLLQKPWTLADLTSRVREVLDRGR